MKEIEPMTKIENKDVFLERGEKITNNYGCFFFPQL